MYCNQYQKPLEFGEAHCLIDKETGVAQNSSIWDNDTQIQFCCKDCAETSKFLRKLKEPNERKTYTWKASGQAIRHTTGGVTWSGKSTK